MTRVLNFLLPLKGFAAVLLMFSMALQGLVPSGYMLQRSDETGKLVVHICNAVAGAEYAMLDPVTGKWSLTTEPSDETDPVTSNEICKFSLSLSATPMSDVIVLLPHLFGLPLLGGRVFVEAHHPHPVRPPLPARGPPLSLI